MKAFTRLRFLLGVLLVIALVGALFLYLNYTLSNISSRSATLEIDSYAVTNEYGGVLRQQFVEPGDRVEDGDRLFEIDSPRLSQILSDGSVDEDSLLVEVTSDGNMILLANAPGIVQQINFSDGAYIESDSQIATIATDNPRYVVARYLLNAPDYARINRDSPVKVTLPDNSHFDAKVFDITLEQEGEQVFTVIKARLPKDANILPTFTSGTPVSTSWSLDTSDWQTTIYDSVRSLIEPQTQR